MLTASDRFTELGGARFFCPDDVVEGGDEPVILPDILVPLKHRTLMRDKTLPVPHAHVKGDIFYRHKTYVCQDFLPSGYARHLTGLPHRLGLFVP